jgi:hypothetical protein
MPWTASANPKIQAQWRQRVAAHRSSGLNQTEFTRQEEYSVTLLGNWRRWFEEAGSNRIAFVELKAKVEAPRPAQQAVASRQTALAMIRETQTQHRIHL